MIRFMFVLSMLFACQIGLAGTSVGNFNRKLQPQFDFRILYPNDWNFLQTLDGNPINTVEVWKFSNARSVADVPKQSSIEISFIKDFPARNDQELIAEAQKRHGKNFNRVTLNPDFVIVSSAQESDSQGGMENHEYILTSPTNVIHIKNRRHSQDGGAAQLDLILSTIRRMSAPLRILSLDMDKPEGYQYKLGEKFCFYVFLDNMRTDSEPLVGIEYVAFKRHHVSYSTKWDIDLGRYELCSIVDGSFDKNTLHVNSLNVNSSSRGGFCYQSGTEKFMCGDKEIIFKPRTVVVKNPDTMGPEIQSIEVKENKELVLRLNETSGYSWGKVNYINNLGEIVSQFLLPEELEGKRKVEIPLKLLSFGFNRIESIIAVDKFGNASAITSHSTEKNYIFLDGFEKKILTNIPVTFVKKDQP